MGVAGLYENTNFGPRGHLNPICSQILQGLKHFLHKQERKQPQSTDAHLEAGAETNLRVNTKLAWLTVA